MGKVLNTCILLHDLQTSSLNALVSTRRQLKSLILRQRSMEDHVHLQSPAYSTKASLSRREAVTSTGASGKIFKLIIIRELEVHINSSLSSVGKCDMQPKLLFFSALCNSARILFQLCSALKHYKENRRILLRVGRSEAVCASKVIPSTIGSSKQKNFFFGGGWKKDIFQSNLAQVTVELASFSLKHFQG